MASGFFRVNRGTSLHTYISNSITEIEVKGLKNFNMPQFENVLGIIDICLDLEIYRSNDDFYVVMSYISEDIQKINKVQSQLVKITCKEFLIQMRKGFKYINLGTGSYNKWLLQQLHKMSLN